MLKSLFLGSSTPPASMAMSAAWYSKLCLFTVVVFPQAQCDVKESAVFEALRIMMVT